MQREHFEGENAMLDPTPERKLVTTEKCRCCGNRFDPEHPDACAEFCTVECAATHRKYSASGFWRRCYRCRDEFVALEKHHVLCETCARLQQFRPRFQQQK
jgi:hypothetical protein